MQIVIRSKKLDITKYVERIIRTENKITDPLLKRQAEAYRKFVQDIIKRNEVLDKKFYMAVNSGGASGKDIISNPFAFDFIKKLFGVHARRVNVNVNQTLQTAQVQLLPRTEHLIKEFNRIGVKVRQLNTQELVELYFDIYNPSAIHGQRIRTNIEDYKTAIVNPAILEE